jgi:hypothetical protein
VGCALVLTAIAGVALLLPGMCFLAMGAGSMGNMEPVLALIGVFLLVAAALLFCLTFAKSKRPPNA